MLAIYPLIIVPTSLGFFEFPNYIILAVFSVLALFFLARDKASLAYKHTFLFLSLFFVFAIISTVLAIDPMKAWAGSHRYTGLSTYLFCIILFFLAYSHISNQDNTYYQNKQHFLLNGMIICASLVSFLALINHFVFNLSLHKTFDLFFKTYGTMGNRNFLGTYTVFILPASIMLYMYHQKKLYLLSTALIYGALVVSLTRGAWIAFALTFVIILFYAVKYLKKPKQALHIIMIIIFMTLVLLPTNNRISSRFSTIPKEIKSAVQLEDSAGSKRMYIWKETAKLIPQYWAFGMGPDNLEYADIRTSKNVIADKAHNIYLEILVTMGVFALFSYLFFLSYFIRYWKGKYEFLFSIMILTYLIQGLFNIDVVMVMPLFWIILGLSLANNQNLHCDITSNSDDLVANNIKKKNRGKKSIFQYIFFAAITVFIIFIIILLFYPRHGTVEVPGGGVYTGQLKGYTFHGQGTWEAEIGTIYKGEFKNGSFHGFGIMTYPNGAQYIGEFFKGMLHGQGKMIFPDGKVMEGKWIQGVFQEED